MKPKLRNIFFLIGLAAVVIMLLRFPYSWQEVMVHARRAGIWLPIVIAMWLPLYGMNALAWRVILGHKPAPSFGRLLKLTISGFALNYVTPVGLLGGEPYRIMELQDEVGSVRATSSVILHSMMHIFSHFCFWAFSIVLFLVLYHDSLNGPLVALLSFCTLFCLAGLYFFTWGYRHGLAMSTLRFFARLPWLGQHIKRFTQRNEQKIQETDRQIAALHSQRPAIFLLSLGLEFGCRMLGCLEILFLLFIFNPHASYWDSVLIQAFTSLFANLVFFIPMQVGAREGGMAWSTGALQLGAGYGVLTSLIIRLRELFWIAMGMLLIKTGNNKQTKNTI